MPEIAVQPQPKLLHQFAVPAGWESVNIGIGPDSEFFHLYRRTIQKRTPLPNFHPGKYEYRFERASKGFSKHFAVGEFELDFFLIQPIGEDEVLLVDPRCPYYLDRGAEKNAVVHHLKGGTNSYITLGDGLNSVHVTKAGEIWCAYSDEGIFGNWGWGDGSPQPLGKSGLASFSKDGKRNYEFHAHPVNELDVWIFDCDAVNVVEDDVWICPNDEYPLVHLSKKKIAGWWRPLPDPNEEFNCYAIAIQGNRALLWRDDEFVLAELEAEHASTVLSRVSSGEFVFSSTVVTGRGDALFLVKGTDLYRLRVSDF